jgi:hypothetical protein
LPGSTSLPAGPSSCRRCQSARQHIECRIRQQAARSAHRGLAAEKSCRGQQREGFLSLDDKLPCTSRSTASCR